MNRFLFHTGMLALLFLSLTPAKAALSPEQLDTLFAGGDIQQAAQGYQDKVVTLAQKKKLLPRGVHRTFPLPASSDSAVLSSTYWFNRGLYFKLQDNQSECLDSWQQALHALQPESPATRPYLRRLAVAIFQETLNPQANFADLIQAAERVSQIIEDSPLAAPTSRFHDQLNAEYLIQTAHRIIQFPFTYDETTPPQTFIDEILAQKSLTHLLAGQRSAPDSSFEALADQLLFAEAAPRIISNYKILLTSIAEKVPPSTLPVYACAAMIWGYENKSRNDAYYLMENLSAEMRDTRPLFTQILRSIQTADNLNFPGLSRELLLCLYQLKRPFQEMETAAKLQVAQLCAEHQLPEVAEDLVQQCLQGNSSVEIQLQAKQILIEIAYLRKDYAKVADEAAKLTSDPELKISPRIWHLQGKSFAQLGRPADAAGALENFLRLQPYDKNAPATLLFISRLYLASGQTQRARQALNTLITRHPNSQEAAAAQPLLASLHAVG